SMNPTGEHKQPRRPVRSVLRALVVLQAPLPLYAFAVRRKGAGRAQQHRKRRQPCCLNFVVQNKSRVAIESIMGTPRTVRIASASFAPYAPRADPSDTKMSHLTQE